MKFVIQNRSLLVVPLLYIRILNITLLSIFLLKKHLKYHKTILKDIISCLFLLDNLIFN